MPKPLSVLCVGDLHFPFARRASVSQAVTLARKLKPKVIVQMGDLYDLYSFSRFARSQNLLTPKQEIERGRKHAEEFWLMIRAAAGKGVECFQILGNHDQRAVKMALATLPELEPFMDHSRHMWQFEGVTTSKSERDELILDGVCYMHGYRKFGEHVRHNLMNTACGHLHRGGVHYMRHGSKTLWELNAGFLADPASIPMSYSAQARFSQHTQGVGFIDDYGPRFIAF